MNNNKLKSGALIAGIAGVAVGMVYGSKMGMLKKESSLELPKEQRQLY